MLDLVGNPEDQFSQYEAQVIQCFKRVSYFYLTLWSTCCASHWLYRTSCNLVKETSQQRHACRRLSKWRTQFRVSKGSNGLFHASELIGTQEVSNMTVRYRKTNLYHESLVGITDEPRDDK